MIQPLKKAILLRAQRLLLLLLMLAAAPSLPAMASETRQADTVIMLFFWSEGCPHCRKEKAFLEQMKVKYPALQVRPYEVRKNRENALLFSRISVKYGLGIQGVPATFIGGLPPVMGFRSERTSGKDIEEKISFCMKNSCGDPADGPDRPRRPNITGMTALMSNDAGSCRDETPCPDDAAVRTDNILVLPLIGELDTSSTALAYQTVLIAGMDSFNPCAFFVLFTLLGMLIHVQSRKRLLLVGGIFVLFSGLIYFVFMAAWLNVFLMTGQISAVTAAAGVVALLMAAINIKDFFLFKKGVSLSIPESAKPRLFDRMRRLLRADSLVTIIAGTVVLAVAANAYELFCTAGFPMIYTRLLTLHNLAKPSYYLYLALYNLIYIVPLAAVVIFFAATLGARKLTETQGRSLKLLSGMMLLCLGLMLLFMPSLLNNLAATTAILLTALAATAFIVHLSGRKREAGRI